MACRSCQGHLGDDRRPSTRPGLDLQPAAEERQPLAHAEEAETLAAAVVGVKPRPSSSITAVTAPVFAGQDDADGGRLCVLDDVRQRLLDDAVEGGLDLGRQPLAGSATRGRPACRSARRRCRGGARARARGRSRRAPSAAARRRGGARRAASRRPARGRRPAPRARSPSFLASSTALRPSSTEVSSWPVWSCSSRARRRRSSSCASTTRRSASPATRAERSTATAARVAKVSARRRSSSLKRGSSPSLSWATMTPIARPRASRGT